jgi:hypothetical protein
MLTPFAEASGGIISWTLSPTKKVRRYDGTRVPMSPNMSWMAELKALMLHLKSPRVGNECRGAV